MGEIWKMNRNHKTVHTEMCD